MGNVLLMGAGPCASDGASAGAGDCASVGTSAGTGAGAFACCMLLLW